MTEEADLSWSLSWVGRKVSPAGGGIGLAIGEASLNQALYIGLELIQRDRA